MLSSVWCYKISSLHSCDHTSAPLVHQCSRDRPCLAASPRFLFPYTFSLSLKPKASLFCCLGLPQFWTPNNSDLPLHLISDGHRKWPHQRLSFTTCASSAFHLFSDWIFSICVSHSLSPFKNSLAFLCLFSKLIDLNSNWRAFLSRRPVSEKGAQLLSDIIVGFESIIRTVDKVILVLSRPSKSYLIACRQMEMWFCLIPLWIS